MLHVEPARSGFVTDDEFMAGFVKFSEWLRHSRHKDRNKSHHMGEEGRTREPFFPQISKGMLSADTRKGSRQSFPPITRAAPRAGARRSLDSSATPREQGDHTGGTRPSRNSIDVSQWYRDGGTRSTSIDASRQPTPTPGREQSPSFALNNRHSDARHGQSAHARDALIAASASSWSASTVAHGDSFAFTSARMTPKSSSGEVGYYQPQPPARRKPRQSLDSDVEAIRSAARRSMDLNSRPAPYRHQQHQDQHNHPQETRMNRNSKDKQHGHWGGDRRSNHDDADSAPKYASYVMVESLRKAINGMNVPEQDSKKKPKHMFLRGDKTHKKLLRAEDMRSYVAAFQGMAVADDGTVQLEDFIKHMNESSPTLAGHAMTMYENLMRKSKKQDGAVDAGAMLRVLFPAICDEDVQNIIDMCKSKPRNEDKIRQDHMLKLLDEAKELFQSLDTNDSGFLSRDEAIQGVRDRLLDMTPTDIKEVFGKPGTSTDRPYIAFDSFYAWYSASDLSSIMNA